jgi:hypothetical protein
MRASDLLGLPVEAADGTPLGVVLDVRLVQDGPLLGAFAALRVDGLIVGKHRLAARLGYDRYAPHGPALLRALVRWWTRHNGFLPWPDAAVTAGRVVARVTQLPAVPPI